MRSRFKFTFLENSTEFMRAIAHPIRIAIIDLLHQNGTLTVTDIHTRLNIEQAIASHHLRIMKDKGILTHKRSGKNTYYGLQTDKINNIIRILEELQTPSSPHGRLVA